MYCVKCGKEVKDGTKFCTNCGAEVETKKEEKKEAKDEKLTYSQNKSIETTSNPAPIPESAKSEGQDGKATASLVLGIVSFVVPCVGFITSIVGLILGICSKKSGKKTAGIILNSIALGLIIIGWIALYSLGYMASWIEEIDTPTYPTTPNIVTPKPSTNNKTGKTYASSTIIFDGFEITLANNYEIITDEKTYTGHYGEKVIKLPATIKNVSANSDHLNMFYYYYYAPDGTKIDSVRSDFGSAQDAIDYVHVDSGESKIQYFYILYKGDGKYRIEFSKTGEAKTIEFTIKK